ncbi:hypothetical protein ACJDU8_17030 [Clostridium sp. WILCCON 0269]|uniref:Uncharacterized protein n=1 Tax=Candidatus Clostridium eludens TaxID=3381663 RepID=A0ABW8SMH1_9CLOT
MINSCTHFKYYVSEFEGSCILLIEEELKKIISGEKILGNNNLENQIERHGKLIYRQIEGFLINVKSNLRNGLIKVLITLINSIEKSVSIA